jgi:hypothetical protein
MVDPTLTHGMVKQVGKQSPQDTLGVKPVIGEKNGCLPQPKPHNKMSRNITDRNKQSFFPLMG